MKRSILLCLAVLPLLIAAPLAVAQWGESGVWVSPNTDNASYVGVAVGANGYTFVVWEIADIIYAQRLDARGVPTWTANGVEVCSAGVSPAAMEVVSDGAGGAIAFWYDSRNGNDDVFAQRLDETGALLWTATGEPIRTGAGGQQVTNAVSDGMGGAIVAFTDYGVTLGDAYLQRVDSGGSTLWGSSGTAVCDVYGGSTIYGLAATPGGGAVTVWQDTRTGSSGNDIWGNIVDPFGTAQWGSEGSNVCLATGSQYGPWVVPMPDGGFIASWEDRRLGTSNKRAYAQRMTYTGEPAWTVDGIPVCTDANVQSAPRIAGDGASGAYIFWYDDRGIDYDIYGQRVTYDGTLAWGGSGLALCTAMGDQRSPETVTDAQGGAIVAWQDQRSGQFDIYAQRVSSDQTQHWDPDGTPMSVGYTYSQGTRELVPDGAGGAVVCYGRRVNAADWSRAYAQRIERHGFAGYPSPHAQSADDVPGDEGGWINVTWDASYLDAWPHELIDRYTVWRSLSAAQAAGLGPAAISRVGIRTQELAGVTHYWEQVDEVTAAHLSTYSATVPSLYDSTATSGDPQYFQVMAHGLDPSHYWESGAASGLSVDNLAPAAPLMLSAQRVGDDVTLEWNRSTAPDVQEYFIYRSETSGFTPGPGTFLATSTDTFLTDSGAAPFNAYYYVVTGVDIHDNEGGPSNEALADVVSAAGDTPALTRLQVLGNMPNPFSGATTLRIGMPEDGVARIAVFDVAGRRVATREQPLAAGWRDVGFNGLDNAGRPLPSGVYFYRVRAAGYEVTKKLTIMR